MIATFSAKFNDDSEETFVGGTATHTFPAPSGFDLVDGAEVKMRDKTYIYRKEEGRIVYEVDKNMQIVGIKNLEEKND